MTTQKDDAPAGCVLLRPDDVARRLGLTVRALDKWRERGTGPAYVRLSARAIRYPLDALEEWVAARQAEGRWRRRSTAS